MKIIILIAAILSVIIGIYVPLSIISDLKLSLVTLVSILLAGLFPAMTLSISLMQSGSLSVMSLNNLNESIKITLKRLIFTYAIGMISLVMILSADALSGYSETIPSKVSQILVAATAFAFLSFALSINGVFDALRTALAKKFIIAKEEASREIQQLGRLETKSATGPGFGDDYGTTVKLPY